MPSVLQKTLKMLVGDVSLPDFQKKQKERPLRTLTDRELLTLESEIGAQLFGPVAEGHRREFFCLDDKNWIWHEEWLDEKKKLHFATTKYEVQEKGILKTQEGARYSYIEGEELNHLITAIGMYYERVMREIYARDPRTGQKLA